MMMKKVACCGSFDYKIHEGHEEFFEFAGSFGELTVFVSADMAIRKYKNRHPYFTQEERKNNILRRELAKNAIGCVDTEAGAIEQILAYKPDIYVFGVDQVNDWNSELEMKLRSIGTEIRRDNRRQGISSTILLKKDGLLDGLKIL